MQSLKHGSSPLGSVHRTIKRRLVQLAILPLIGVGLLVFLLPAYGDQLLLQRSLTVSNSTAGATAQYTVSFTLQTSETLGSIRLQFCSNNPLINQPCTAPGGFSLSSASLSAQSGETGFTISNTSTSNVLILTRSSAVTTASQNSYTLSGVINPNAAGSYYVRAQTFASNDASGADNDYGGLAFSMASLISISTEVPPYLNFCTGLTIINYDCTTAQGNYLNFGNASPQSSLSAQSQFLIVTNAPNGYAVTVNGTTLTSGNNVIPALGTADISRPGESQFGINLRANSDPAVGVDVQGPGAGLPVAPYNIPDYFAFRSGDTVASGQMAENYRKYTVSYLLNISRAQPVGVYASTLSYIASGNF